MRQLVRALIALASFALVAPGAFAAGDAFFTVDPCRAIDTRSLATGGPALLPGQTAIFTLAGACGIPPDAKEVAINITAVAPTVGGSAAVFAGDAAAPSTSVISFNAGQTRASNTIVQLASDGSGTMALLNGSLGTTHFVIDISGYFVPACDAPTFSTTSVGPLCNGESTGSITFSASGGTGTLSYSINGGGSFQASNVFPGLAAGAYNLVVQDSVGCSNFGTATLTDPPALTFTTTNVNPAPPGSSNGSITFNASGGTGALSYSIDGGSSLLASNAFPGLPAGTYNLVVKDANACTKTGTATLTDAPIAVNDSYGTPVNTALRVFEVRVHVVDNDYTNTGIGGSHFDPTIHIGDTVTWVWDQGTHTSTSSNPTEVWDSGSLTVGTTFSHTFTNVGDFSYGSTGEPSMTGVVHVLAGLRLGVLGNDTLSGATITSYGTSIGNEQTTIGAPTPTSAGGTVSLYTSGGFLYAPPSAVFTGSDTFKYILSNVSGLSTATVTITVLDPPTAADDAYQAAKNTVLPQAASGVLGNDTLNTATIASYGTPNGTEQTSIGSATPTAAGGSITLNADGSFSYNPLNNFTGTDTFKYKLTNVTGSSTATVTFTVVAAPTAVDDNYLAGKNTPLVVLAAQGVTSNDTLNSATIFSYGATTGGEQTSIGSSTPTSAGGSVTLNADGSFTFTPLNNFTGSDTFKYVLKNAAGTSTGLVTFNVVPPPVAVADSYNVPSNTTTNKNAASGVLPNDTVNSATIVSYGTPNGTEQTAIGSATPTLAGGSITLNADGSFAYTPLAAFTGIDTFKYKLQNPAGSSTATVTFTVLNPPNAVNDSHGVTGNVAIAPAAPGVLSNDTGTTISIISYGATTGGEQTTIGASTPTSQGGTVALNANGSYTYGPPANFTGADTFKYKIDNALATPSTGTVTLNVSSRIMFVSSAGVGNCKPASTCALSTAGAAAAVSSGKDLIFVLSGSYSSASITLKSGQAIVGQQVSFAQALADAAITLAADSESIVIGASTAPTFSNAGNVLTLGGGNLIEYFTVNPSTGAGIFGNSTVTGTMAVNGVVMNPSGTANGVSLTSQAALHTFNYNSGSITSTSSGAAVLMSGASGAGPATLAIAISSSSGKPIDISSRTGGTVAFNGAVSGTGQGISLTTNTGSTINFTGGISLSTGSNAAFTATGGGTISATQNNTSIVNTLTTTSGTALNVANTTIGAAGLTFRSISSNGAASGIILNTTAAGTLTITGNGGSCTSAGTCTGGAIQASTGPGMTLTSTAAVSFANVDVENGGDDGIRGSTVGGFTLTNSRVMNNGNAVTERGIEILNLTGTGGISNSTISGNAEDNLYIQNTSGTLSSFNVTGSTFSNTSTSVGNDGIHFEGQGTAHMTISVTGSTFSHNRGDHFQVVTDAIAAGVVMNATFSDNTLTGDRGTTYGGTDLGACITINPGGAADVTYDIQNNNITGAVSSAISINSSNTSVLHGTINNNTIGTVGTLDSGSSQGDGFSIFANNSSAIRALITNNSIRQYSNLAGINIQQRSGSATVQAVVTGNTISNGGTFAAQGIFVSSGTTSGDSGTMCLDIGGAGVLANSFAGSGANGADDFRVRQRFNTTVRLPGYGGTNQDTAAVVAFIQGRNTGGPSGTATVPAPFTGGGFIGGAACTAP